MTPLQFASQAFAPCVPTLGHYTGDAAQRGLAAVLTRAMRRRVRGYTRDNMPRYIFNLGPEFDPFQFQRVTTITADFVPGVADGWATPGVSYLPHWEGKP